MKYFYLAVAVTAFVSLTQAAPFHDDVTYMKKHFMEIGDIVQREQADPFPIDDTYMKNLFMGIGDIVGGEQAAPFYKDDTYVKKHFNGLWGFVRGGPVAPFYKDGTYVMGHFKSLWNIVGGELNQKIEELRRQRYVLKFQIRKVSAEANGHFFGMLEQVNRELSQRYTQLMWRVNEIFGQGNIDSTYFNDSIREKLRELRSEIVEKTRELAIIVKEQAAETGEMASKHLMKRKDQVINELGLLKDQLLLKIREWMIPENEVDETTYVVDEAFEQIVRNMKMQISYYMAVISDFTNMFSESGRAKMREAREKVHELLAKLRETVRQWREKKQHEEQSATYVLSDYAMANFITKLQMHLGHLYQTVTEKREEVAMSVDQNKAESLDLFMELQNELQATKEEIGYAIREIFHRHETYSTTSTDVLRVLRRAMKENLRELTSPSYMMKDTRANVKYGILPQFENVNRKSMDI